LSSLAPSAARFFAGFLTLFLRSSASKSPGFIAYSGKPALLELTPRGGGFYLTTEDVPSPLVLSPPDVVPPPTGSFLVSSREFSALFLSFFFAFAALIFCCF